MATTNKNEQINFLALRRLYEQKRQSDKVEDLIATYLKHFINKDTKYNDIPLLQGLRLSEEFLKRNLDSNALVALLINGTAPRNKIIDVLVEKKSRGLRLNDDFIELYQRGIITLEKLRSIITDYNTNPDLFDFDYFSKLYKDGYITIEFLQFIITRAEFRQKESKSLPKNIENIVKLMSSEDFSSFQGLNMEEIEKTFTYFLTNDRVLSEVRYYKEVFETACKFLTDYFYPNSQSRLRDYFLKAPTLGYGKEVLYMFHDALKTILERDGIIKTLERMSLSSNLLSIFTATTPEAKAILKSSANMEELYQGICVGKVWPVELALCIFPELQKRKVNIVNEWIKNQLTLPIDIYMSPILDGSLVQDVDNYDLGLYRDQMYMEALAPEKSKPFAIEPTSSEQN